MPITVTVTRHPGLRTLLFTLELPRDMRTCDVLGIDILEASGGFDPPVLSVREIAKPSENILEVSALHDDPDIHRVIIGVQHRAHSGGYTVRWTEPITLPSAPRIQAHHSTVPALQT